MSQAMTSPNWRVRNQTRSYVDAQQSNQTVRRGENEETADAIARAHRIYVGNLLYRATESDVLSLLQNHGYSVQRLDMSIDPMTGKNPSYCFVELPSREEANWAVRSLNGALCLGRPIKVNACVPKRQKLPSSVVDRWASDTKLQHGQLHVDQSNRVFVGGLAKPETQRAGEISLETLFKDYTISAIGKIISPKAKEKHDPSNRYFAFVTLATKEEARHAIDHLNHTFYQGHRITVSTPRRTYDYPYAKSGEDLDDKLEESFV